MDQFTVCKRESRVPLRLEVSGSILSEVSVVLSALSGLAVVFFSSLAEVTTEAKDMVVRWLRRH